MSLSEIIFKAGAKRRNPGLYDRVNFLRQSEGWKLDQLKEYQLNELKKLLLTANKHSLFYRNYFRENGFDPAIKSLDDFKQLPPINKAQLISDNKDIHTGLKLGKHFFCETSGSSGQVLTFWRNEAWDSANRATVMRGLSWYEVDPWESSVYFWGYNIKSGHQLKTRLLDVLQNRYRLFDYSPETLRQLFRRLESVTYMHGYASMIYELARVIQNQNIDVQAPRLRLIKGTSEQIFPHYQDTLMDVFGKKMISEYGATESGVIAFECPAGSLHLMMENVLVEEEENEILVTNLVACSFPIIRYRLGDYVKLAKPDRTCACGLDHPTIEEVEGRVGKNIYGEINKYPSLTLYYVFKNLFFEKDLKFNYQCIQGKKGSLTVLIKEPFSTKGEESIRSEFEKYFKTDVAIQIIFSQDFHTYKEKVKDFISKIE